MALPSVRLTQQDFVSTFPWGFRGDRVRILQQEVENEILDAETLAAMAFMLGLDSCCHRLDEAWKLLLNSQNHDVHVCLFDEVGIDWCEQARIIAAEVRQKAASFIAGHCGGGAQLNTLSWDRLGQAGKTVPAFGYAKMDAGSEAAGNKPWKDWFDAGSYRLRVLDHGCLEAQLTGVPGSSIVLGQLTVWADGQTRSTTDGRPSKLESHISADGRTATARITATVGNIAYVQEFTATLDGIDIVTEVDYGDGRFFGPEPQDIQREPYRRAHYFQHDRKLCFNITAKGITPRMLYNSPFLTWPAEKPGSVDSLHFAAMEDEAWGFAHFNIGQGGYWYDDKGSLRHVMAFAPRSFVYGSQDKLRLTGKHRHLCRILPYAGDWRAACLPMRSAEFNRPLISVEGQPAGKTLTASGSLLQVDSNSTIATAMFERDGRIFVRLWEWSGQEDHVQLRYGEGSRLSECSHRLGQPRPISSSFSMRPWEIKTVELTGKAKLLEGKARCSAGQVFQPIPEGWTQKNYFEVRSTPVARTASNDADAPIYFVSGYHDGFVRPLEKHTDTMAIEMERVQSPKYRNYTTTWEIGGNCWDRMSKNEPQYLESLKPLLKNGSVEVVGGTWSEPLSLVVSGESNIRQFMYGMDTMESLLDTKIRVYMNQEHATFAQMPQILSSMGLTAVVNRTQWAPFGIESGLDVDVARWVGVDGSSILIIPRYNSMDYLMGNHAPELAMDYRHQHDSLTGHNRYWRREDRFRDMGVKARQRGVQKPLITMLEDIWEVGLRSTDEEMEQYNSYAFVHFTTIERYLKLFDLR